MDLVVQLFRLRVQHFVQETDGAIHVYTISEVRVRHRG